MEHSPRTFLPAAGHAWALPLYDPLSTLLGVDKTRRALLEEAELRPHHTVLDVGCGTGSLVVMAKQMCPGAELVGLDPDHEALRRSARKARRAGVQVRFDQGFADKLPYADASFDRVLSSFMLHHLREAEQAAMLREVHRVLKPGGTVHIVDLAPRAHGARGFLQRRFHKHSRAHFAEDLAASLRDAGFETLHRVKQRMLLQDVESCHARRAR